MSIALPARFFSFDCVVSGLRRVHVLKVCLFGAWLGFIDGVWIARIVDTTLRCPTGEAHTWGRDDWLLCCSQLSSASSGGALA